MKIITLAACKFTLDSPPDKFGTVAVPVVRALFHEGVHGGDGGGIYRYNQSRVVSESSRVTTHWVTSS
tara:strand:- start:204 stop:407 length:204 start_codon:yes stop_codon:yes gene_type:complete